MDGALGAHVRGEIAKRGLVAFEKPWDNGYRQITSAARPIRMPEDLRGFKIGVPVSPLWTSLFRAFGAAPTNINFSETYSALQTRLVDGQENPLAVIDVAKLYEVQNISRSPTTCGTGSGSWPTARALEALPAGVSDIVRLEFNRSAVEQRADVARLNGAGRSRCSRRGWTFIRTDPAAFRAALRKAGFYAEWRQKFGDEAWGHPGGGGRRPGLIGGWCAGRLA